MTYFTTFINDYIFPLFLLFFFIYVAIYLPQTQIIEVKAVREPMTHQDRLETFYELILQNPNLQSELDTISDRDSLVSYLVHISAGCGYHFTASDINNSINEHTEVSQVNYICLPIGCWRVSS